MTPLHPRREPTTVPFRATARRTSVTLAGVLGVLLAVLCGCAPTPPVARSGDVDLRVDGRDRTYLLEPAVGLKPGQRAALVVVLHQEGGTPAGVAAETALQDLRRSGVTLAYPAGVDGSWDAGACCGIPRRQGVDDVRFLDAVFTDVARRTPVDPRRRALVGYSSGGMLTYRFLCSPHLDVHAAVVVSGSLESSCAGRIRLPDVLALHGMRDGTIGVSRPVFVRALGLAPRAATVSLSILTRSAHCSMERTSHAPELEIRTWTCGDRTVQALLVPRMGHGWAGLDATRRTRNFLLDRLLT